VNFVVFSSTGCIAKKLPVGALGQQMECQMWNFDPGQQEKSGIIRQQVTVSP